MAAFATYSTTPALNVTIRGVNSAEGCPAANQNDISRALASEGRELYDIVAALNVTGLMPKSGGAFTGTITRSGAGGYFYHANAAQATAPVYTQPLASALPASPAEGTVVLQY